MLEPNAKGEAVPEDTRVPGCVQTGPGDGHRPRLRPDAKPSVKAPDTGRAKQLGALNLGDHGPAPTLPEAAPGRREPMDNGKMTGAAATVMLKRGGLGKTTKIGGVAAGGMIQLGRRTLPLTLHRGGRKSDRQSLGSGTIKETPQEEARRLILGPPRKGPEDLALKSSAGSTEEVPTAKRAADMMAPGEPSPRTSRPPPQPKLVVQKWREWILLQQLLRDLRKAGADDLLADHVARGNYVKKHGDFHQRPKCRDVPRAGNWILAQMGVLLACGICGSASTWMTYGTCVETWVFSISQIQDFEHILHMLVEAIKVLQSLMEELPATMHETVQWSGTESALQTLLQEYYPYPDTDIEAVQGDQQLDPIDVSDTSGSQAGDGPKELASGSAEAPQRSDRTQGAELHREDTIPRPLSKDRQEMVSKRLSVVLRHDKGEFQLRFDDRALVPLEDVLNLPIMYKQHIDRQQVLSAIHHNDKKRFRVVERDGQTFVGANQGHSFSIDPERVRTRARPAEMPSLVHATHYDFLQSILQSGIRPGGLREGHRQMVHCLPDTPSSARYYPPGVDVVLHISPQHTGVQWYRSENGYYMTKETVPPQSITMVSVLGSEEVVQAEGDLPPDLRTVAKIVLRVQSKGSRTSAPSGSSASRAYMFALPACRHTNSSQIHNQMRRSVPPCHITPRQDDVSSAACPYGPALSNWQFRVNQRRSSYVLARKPDSPPTAGGITKLQLTTLACLLLCAQTWLGGLKPQAGRQLSAWLVTRVRQGIYRRRLYLLQTCHSSDEVHFQEATPTPPHRTRSRTGPKSSGHCRILRTHLVVVLLAFHAHSTGATKVMAEARVAADTSAAAGAVERHSRLMPRHGENTGEAECNIANGIRWTAKRALRRARARAEKEGGTRYRGRWFTAEQLSRTRRGIASIPTDVQKNSASKNSNSVKRETGRRIKCMTFNISGASSSAWQECMAWLQDNQQHVDIALVQETHWKGEGSRDFVSAPWFVVTTGAVASDSKAGLAVLVHKRLGGPEQISAQTHLKGRLMHVRVHQGDNSIDIINLYQHVWRSQLDREGNTKCREAVWKKLRQVTTKIPQRNTLVVGGDFNCTIRRMKHHIGSAVIEAREPSPDQEELLGYLQDHGVTLLNTWHAKPAYTCQTGNARTQIDFLLCREQHADKTAKDSQPWHQAPIGKWKVNHHVPVWASIRHIDPGKLPRKPVHKSFKNTLQGSIELNDRQAQQLQTLVAQKISTLPSTGNIADMSDQLDWIMTSTISEVYYPGARDDRRLSQDPQVQLSVKAMWRTYARYREAKTATFLNIFAKWKQFALFHKTSRAYKAKTKEVKKERILQTAQELAQADQKGDQRKLWERAKRLAPWKPKDRTSLRGCAGEILAPQQQLSELVEHSKKKFCCGAPYISQHSLDADFWIDPVQLEQYLGQIPMRKAVPKHIAPAAAWRLCAKSVASAIAASANRSWVAGTSARMPQPWRDTHLVWLAKPNKNLDRPNGYRPIGLSHPLAKIINRILRDRLCEYVDPKLEGLPQFAYTKGRGVVDALLRVHHHFRKARKIALASKASIYQQHQGIKSKTCAGGLCFSLDLEGAFDSVPRTQLAASMRRLQISEDLIHMAMEFYRNSRYFSSIGTHEDSVTSTCGIKQGCTLAPYLFVIHTVTIIEEIGRSLGNGWMQEMLTFFADDSIATWEIHCIADLKKAMAGIETIVTIFNNYGMKLSNDKCVILYDLQGREAHKFISKRKHRRNKLPHFKFLQMGEDLWVPI